MVYDNFCKSKKCEFYIEWDFGFGTCFSCRKIGESYNIVEYPKDCKYLKEIENYNP